MTNMQRVSSNLTLVLKLFLPTLWIVFFSTFTIALFITDEEDLPFLTSAYFKYPFLLVFLLFLTLLYITFLKLKRIEMGPECYYVSNYLRTFRLVYDDIENINSINLGRFWWVTFDLRAKGSFGKKITFLINKELFDIFMAEHKEVKQNFPILSNINGLQSE